MRESGESSQSFVFIYFSLLSFSVVIKKVVFSPLPTNHSLVPL